MPSTPKSMMSKATITCHSAICLERFSLCCGAGSERGRWGIMCRTCGKPFVGGKCGTFDTPPAKGEEWEKELKELMGVYKLDGYDCLANKDYKLLESFISSLRSQAYEEGYNAGEKWCKELNFDHYLAKKQDKLIGVATKEAYEEGYLKGYKEGSGGISGDVLALHDQYEKGYNDGAKRQAWMREQVEKKAYEEGKREAIELVKKHIVHTRAICKERDCLCEYRDRNVTLWQIIDALKRKEKV